MLDLSTMRQLAPALHLTPDRIGTVVFGVVAMTGLALYIYFNRKPDPAEAERQRRLFLAERGRITDATLIDTRILEMATLENRAPDILQYQYRVAGVAYESSQDVSPLGDCVRDLRVDLPIQIRYDPHNPGNSIVVAESWSGLRLGQ